MKDNFGEKRFSKEKFIEFFENKGFYIVLALCIVIIGVTAVFISNGAFRNPGREYDNEDIISSDMLEDFEGDTDNIAFNDEDEFIQSSADATQGIEDDSGSTGVKSSETETALEDTLEDSSISYISYEQSEAEGDTQEEIATGAEEEIVETATETLQEFIMPVYGEITFDYSMDKLVYSKTLEDWRTHRGIDIGSSRGTPVKVVADGVVREIINDPRFGITIIVEHADNVKTVYANLANDSTVTPNQKVKQGEVISSVGNTAIFESAEPAHLHFEVLKDNKPADPREYLPIKNN